MIGSAIMKIAKPKIKSLKKIGNMYKCYNIIYKLYDIACKSVKNRCIRPSQRVDTHTCTS